MTDLPHSSNDDALDALLREARWPEPGAGAIARLRQAGRRRFDFRPLALAASVLIALGLFAWSTMPRKPIVVSQRAAPVMHIREIGRSPTALELAIVRSLETKPRAALVVSQPKIERNERVRPAQAPAPVDQTSEARRLCDVLLKSEPDAFAAVDRAKSPLVDELIQLLNDRRVETRIAAAKLLGHVDGPDTTRKLVALADNNQNRREALMALALSNGAEAKSFMQSARTSGPLVSAARSIRLEEIH